MSPADLWHIGSITKSFTSLLMAKFVERGEMSWTSTLGDLLGARTGKFAPVNLAQLLSHRAGLPANVLPGMMASVSQGAPTVRDGLGVADDAGPARDLAQRLQHLLVRHRRLRRRGRSRCGDCDQWQHRRRAGGRRGCDGRDQDQVGRHSGLRTSPSYVPDRLGLENQPELRIGPGYVPG